LTPRGAHRRVAVVACVAGEPVAMAESLLAGVGMAIGRSGLLSPDDAPERRP
jgi:hypothetical protein